LAPLTDITNKSLLPVYNKPLIHYPLQILLDAGIKDIIIISGTEHIDQIAEYLGSGSKFGCTFTFKVQEKAGGIAQALGLAADEFDDGESVCAILGDNIYFDDLSAHIQSFNGGGHVFLKEVDDPNRFGIAELSDGKVVSVEEKPSEPKSNLAITGCYIYDNRCFEIIKNMKPSARGEFEITDVTDWYLQHGELTATTLKEDWIDAGTFESLFLAASKVRDQNNS